MTYESNTINNLYTINQVAEILAVSKITVYRLVEAKKIPYYKIKGCVRILETDILKYLDKNRIDSVN